MNKEEQIKLKISLLNHRSEHLVKFIGGPAHGWGECHERRALWGLLKSVEEKVKYLESLLETEVNP